MYNDNQTGSSRPIKRLYRSQRERIIGGVCGGIAQYLDMDPVMVRIIFLVLVFFGGIGLLAYFLGWFIIPKNPDTTDPGISKPVDRSKIRFIFGLTLLVAGIAFLLRQLAWNFGFFYWHIPWQSVWSLVLITAGIFLLFSQRGKKSTAETSDISSGEIKPLSRSSANKMIWGVCGGIAEHFNIDPTLVRMSYALLSIASIGVGILIYVLLALMLPSSLSTTQTLAERRV